MAGIRCAAKHAARVLCVMILASLLVLLAASSAKEHNGWNDYCDEQVRCCYFVARLTRS